MEFKPEILERLQKLEEKYEAMGQDLKSYLDGLLYADYPTYWNYIRLDTLLSLQKSNTDFPDEQVFIVYHQITELYFKLIIHELKQIAYNGREVLTTGEDLGWRKKLPLDFFLERVNRINRYFESLIQSFEVMVDGMEKEQFLRFRMALLPASGFQSAQYRMIEICSTDFIRLVSNDVREEFINKKNPDIEEMYKKAYWKRGATELATGKKTLTLRQFEKKYATQLAELAEEYKNLNLWAKYKSLSAKDQQNNELISALRQFDVNANINWRLVHYKSAVRYLQMDTKDIKATGGTNWQKYLPPKFQKRIFYPELWSDDEIANWGKGWVESIRT